MFVVIIEDRHADVEVELFHLESRAMGRAIEIALDGAKRPDDYQRDLDPPAGWKFYATYSPEGDSVRVVEREPSW